MLTPELEKYIKESLEQGIPDSNIKSSLRSAGWQESDVNEGFNKIKPSQPQPSFQPSPQEEIKVLNINETGKTIKKSNKKFGKIILILAIIIVLAVGGYFGYKYFKSQEQSNNEVINPISSSTSILIEQSVSTSTSATTTQSTVISPTTKPLDEATIQLLSSVSSDSSVYTFNGTTTQLDSLVPGDIIVFGISNKTPYGALRKVQSINKVGVGAGIQVQVQTTQATLEETIIKGSFEASGTLEQ